MFGYVNVYKDELKVKDYNIYKAYYCGLCKVLKSEFSNFVRLGLSYDFAFLALLLSSVSELSEEGRKEICIAHPTKKRPVIYNNPFITYSAYMSIITTYFKLKDDICDEKKLKSFIAVIFYKRHLKKARKRYPEKYDFIKNKLNELNQLEKNCCSDIDVTSDCFGKILESLCDCELLNCDKISREALKNFGYNLGRFIYIIDAADDLSKDIKKNNYNPLYLHYKGRSVKEICKIQESTISLTLADLSKAFELVNFNKNGEIVKNVVYLGLRYTKDRVLKGMVKNNGSV